MKRFALAILVVAAVAALVFAVLNRPGAEASPDFTITVDSADDTVDPNFELTLREAMMLATGDLSLAQLTQWECNQVSDSYWELFPLPAHCESMGKFEPGAASADTIVFHAGFFPPGDPATITLDDTLPELDTGDDTVDGSAAGVIVEGEYPDHMFACFEITSNDNTIKGLGIQYCDIAVGIGSGAQGNTIGGSTQAERNVIFGNDWGVGIYGNGTDGNVVKGNYIGTDASGTGRGANFVGVGICCGAQSNTIGGTTAAERNVISFNLRHGVSIEDSGTTDNTVKGNYIGTNAAGTAPLPNGSGVYMAESAQDNTIGGSTEAERNVISGNDEFGVEIEGDGTDHNRVEGNYIGINAAGDAPIPNGQHGVYIGDGAQSNIIGGTAAGKGNTIAFNNQAGVSVDGAATTGNAIRGNSIHSNGGKGIYLVDGGNTELEPPTITGFGSVMGTAYADCEVDIYSDDEDEGRVYEGSTTADDDGNWSFSGTPGGPNATATATDGDGNTSEFSVPVAVPEPAPTPSPTPSPTPTATPTVTPTPGATRTLVWGPGWHNATWSGASTPEDAFACAAGNYAAAYRLVSGGWERYFPDRPELSNMTDLAQYDVFLILITGDVTCEMTVADPPGTERTLDWGVGWQNEGWTGVDGTAPEDVFDCAEGSYAAAYRLVGGGWERYFPDRPDISTMGSLDEYDAFLILVTAPVNCSMAIAP